MARTIAASICLGWLWSATATARAPEPGDGVQWSAPAECPDDREVERRIAGYVAVPAGFVSRRIDVVADADGFSATLVEEGEPPRTLHAPSCDTLADAVAVVVALAVEAAQNAEPPVVTEPEVVPEVPPVVDETDRAAAVEATRPLTIGTSRTSVIETRRRGGPVTLGTRAALGYTSMLAPRGGAWLLLGLTLGQRWWSIEADGRLFLPRTFEAATFDYGARIMGGAGRLAGCGRPAVGRVAFPICVGVEAGAVRVDPQRLRGGDRTIYPWLAPMLSAALRLAVLPRLAVLVGGELVVPGLRPKLEVAGDPPLFETPAVGGRAFVGLEVTVVRGGSRSR